MIQEVEDHVKFVDKFRILLLAAGATILGYGVFQAIKNIDTSNSNSSSNSQTGDAGGDCGSSGFADGSSVGW